MTKLKIQIKVTDLSASQTYLIREFISSCEGDTCLAPEIDMQRIIDDAVVYKNSELEF